MIWFFLMGMIAGAVGVIMYASYWMRKNAHVFYIDPEEDEKEEEKTDD